MSQPRSWTVTVDWLGRPPTVNGHRRLHFHERARCDREWRAGGIQAARIGRVRRGLAAISVEVWGQYPNRSGLPDVDGVQPAAKAVIDGLRDYGVVEDDSAGFVRAITYRAPQVVPGCRPGLVLRITEEA